MAERDRWSEPREGTPRADLVHPVLDQVLLGDPYYLLPAALGACTSMTVRMYADRNGLATRAGSSDIAALANSRKGLRRLRDWQWMYRSC